MFHGVDVLCYVYAELGGVCIFWGGFGGFMQELVHKCFMFHVSVFGGVKHF